MASIATQRRPRAAASTSLTRPIHLGSRSAVAMTMLAYAWILHYAYATQIAPVFSYLGQTYRTPDPGAVAVSTAVTVGVGLALPRTLRTPSAFVLWTLFLLAIAPSILIAQYADILPRPRALQSAVVIGALSAVFIVCVRAARWPSAVSFRVPVALLQLGACGFTLGLTTLLVLSGGASFSLVGLTAVADVRVSYKALVASLPPLGYAIQFQLAVLNPLFMSLGVAHRRILLILAGAAGQLLIYSVTGYKLAALSPIFVIALALATRHRRALSGLSMGLSITAAMVAAVGADAAAGGRFFVTVFINRLISGPGILTSAYLQVFGGQPKYHWSYSVLAPFYDSPYDLTPGYLVGAVFQKVRSQANANPIGDGYANWGWAGVVIELAFLVILLALLDASARGVPLEVAAPSCLVAAIGLTNNSALSAVLTGGFGGLILVFALWPRDEGERMALTSAADRDAVRRGRRATTGATQRGRSRTTSGR